MTLNAPEVTATNAATRLAEGHWRDDRGSANPANQTVRVVFLLVACASLLPLVAQGIALMAGIALAWTLGNPYPLTTARVITPLLQ
jgi:hypothetical protein